MFKRTFKKIIGNSQIRKGLLNFGQSIFNKTNFDKVFNYFFGRLPYHISELLKQKGNYKIVGLSVCRAPIKKAIDGLFNILSLGKFDEIKKNLGYDDLFHLYLIISLENGESIKLEKNQDINIMMNPIKEGECIEINISGLNATLNDALDKTKNYMGEEKFYKYDGFNNNCQDFVLSFIKSNGLDRNNNTVIEFIKQRAQDIIKELPEYIQTVSNTTTDTASYINRFISFISRGKIGFKEGGVIQATDGFKYA